MANDAAISMRKERIFRLLRELEYELTRGVMENEIEEEMTWQYILPLCRSIPGGIVAMEFRMRPLSRHSVPMTFGMSPPKLRIVGENDTQ